ncbi:hypothetical protein [Sedimenticola hydrogenitrophicus]|uniref:hypothetical protein n=1 Tax=Sedimenticola hydrogenitrophicus TaxID=2967975 RepID=UPI0023B0DCCD|nr:hypothetical protein [Sedimenticola hydrogenitrophicus]
MNKRWVALPLLALTTGAVMAAGGVSVISVNGVNGAWIGYSDGSVRFCTGGGGTAIPYWHNCTTVVEANGSAVTDIGNSDQRAWIGHADGRLHYCKESGSDQNPLTECVDVKP